MKGQSNKEHGSRPSLGNKKAVEEKAKSVLSCLLKKSGSSKRPEEVLQLIKLPKTSATNNNIVEILKEISNNIPTSEKLIKDFRVNLRTLSVYDSFAKFLSDISPLLVEKVMPITQTSVLVSVQSPPNFCSTVIGDAENNLPDYVQEIRGKVVQAATDGLSKTAQRTSFTGVNLIQNSLSVSSSTSRSQSSWDFILMGKIQYYQQNNALALPVKEQEITVLHELIYCLIGIPGTFITPEQPIDQFDSITFKISDQIQSSFIDQVNQILPLACYYSQIQRFIEYARGPTRGQVLQALSAALRSLVNEYFTSVSQLDSELTKHNLNIHNLLYLLRPTINTMEVISDTVVRIGKSEVRGGRVLTLLHDKIVTLTGDLKSQKVLIHLTEMAARPYMEILKLWILKGVIVDPQAEFLVEDNEIIGREELTEHQHYSADYWEKRYTITRDRIPRFLEKVSDVILRTGKYLNVIRQCGKNVTPPFTSNLSFSHSDQDYVTFINTAYQFASQTLLELLLKENHLMGHLQSVKRYFLLQQGDFIAKFMDTCEQELSKNVDEVLPMRLENLLQLTLRLSSARHDPYYDDLKTELLPYDLITQMSKIIQNEEEYWQAHDKLDLTGLQCFAFDYDVKWPVSLVLNHIAISKYQMLFRQLFYCKHVERQLNLVWIATNHAKKFSSETAELYRSAFTLRQRMMNAIQNIEYYMMIEVIEPNWHTFIGNIEKVENVDDVLIVHQDFLDLCLKNCMLTDPNLLRPIVKLCTVCLSFCDFIQKAQRHFVDAELTSMLCSNENSDFSDSETEFSSQKQSESSLAPSDTFSERVKRFDFEFTGVLIGLIKRITEIASQNPSDKFINLVHRINFNSYYSDLLS